MTASTNEPTSKTKTLLPKKKKKKKWVNVHDNLAKYTFVLRLQIVYILERTVSSYRRILKVESSNKPSTITLEPV